MKIKIRPFGWLNLLHLFIIIFIIVFCLTLVGYNLISQQYNIFQMLAILFVYPLVIYFIRTYNRSIVVDENSIIFNIDIEKGSLFTLPKFYEDKFSLKDLKYYGVFTAPYIKGYQKAERPKGIAYKDRDPSLHDILEVKEGKLKVPLGSIMVGNPLAFVFQKQQYIIDDYLFTREQYAALFRAIKDNTNITPSGGIKAGVVESNKSGLVVSLLTVVGGALALALPIGIALLLMKFTDFPISLQVSDYSSSVFLCLFALGNLSLLIKYRSRILKSQNFATYDVLEFIANICLGIFYLCALIIFVVAYII